MRIQVCLADNTKFLNLINTNHASMYNGIETKKIRLNKKLSNIKNSFYTQMKSHPLDKEQKILVTLTACNVVVAILISII